MSKRRDRTVARGEKDRDHEEKSDPVCSVCMSEEFYEDEQGGMICVACGTQSQDFLAEGFDEDDLAVYGGGTGKLVSQRHENRNGRTGSDREDRPSKVDQIADTLEALKLYQYVLQMIFDASLIASGILLSSSDKGSNELVDTCRATLKNVWMDYVSTWKPDTYSSTSSSSSSGNLRHNSRCSIGMAFTRSSACRCTCKDVGNPGGHPLLPSKQLLLALVYLTFRLLRSDVLISDVLRWVESGVVPFSNLWEAIPPKWRESVRMDMRWFYDHPVSEKRPLITPEGLFFFTCSIAHSLRPQLGGVDGSGLVLPPLNAPLVARRIIRYMGLPDCVWEVFCKFTQLGSTNAVSLIGAGMHLQHYEERIMAAIVVAVKFSPRWTEWSLGAIHHSIPNSSNSNSSATASSTPLLQLEDLLSADGGIASLPRESLPAVLAQLRRTHRSHATMGLTKRGEYALNHAVYAALGGTAGSLQSEQSQYSDNNYSHTPHLRSSSSSSTAQSLYVYGGTASLHTHSSSVRFGGRVSYARDYCLPQVALLGDSPLTEELSLQDRRRWNYLNGIEPFHGNHGDDNTRKKESDSSKSKKGGVGKAAVSDAAAYMAYTRYAGDETSLHHAAYLILLERCARYLYVNPQLLHELVCQLEMQIVNLAFTGESTGTGMGVDVSVEQAAKENVYTYGSAKSAQQSGNGRVIDATRVTRDSIQASRQSIRAQHNPAQLREVDDYREQCDVTLPNLRKEGLITLALKAQLHDRRPSETESANEAAEEREGSEREGVLRSRRSSSRNHTTISGSGSRRGLAAAPFRFSRAGEFWDIEEAYGTEHEARHRTEQQKQLLVGLKVSSKSNTRKRSSTGVKVAAGGEGGVGDDESQDSTGLQQRRDKAQESGGGASSSNSSGGDGSGDSEKDNNNNGSDSSSEGLSDWEHTPYAFAEPGRSNRNAKRVRVRVPKETSAAKMVALSQTFHEGTRESEEAQLLKSSAPGMPLPIPISAVPPTTSAVKPISLRDLILSSQSSPSASAATGVSAPLSAGVGVGGAGGIGGLSALQQAIAGVRPPGQAGDFSSSSDDEQGDRRSPAKRPRVTSIGNAASAAGAGVARPVVALKRPRPAVVARDR